MKTISKISIGLIATAILIAGCSDGAKTESKASVGSTVTEASLGLRKTDLYSEDSTSASKTEYRHASAGSSSKMKRAFQDAPPMIPHSTEGMLPIKIGNNQCTGCHMPETAKYMDPMPTPIPVSHFTDFRPKHKIVDGTFTKVADNYKNDVSIKKTDHLQGARFNCSQCHAPQSQGNLAVENTFEAQYTSKDGAERSRWSGDAMTADLATIHGGDNFVTKEDIANKNSAAGSIKEAEEKVLGKSKH